MLDRGAIFCTSLMVINELLCNCKRGQRGAKQVCCRLRPEAQLTCQNCLVDVFTLSAIKWVSQETNAVHPGPDPSFVINLSVGAEDPHGWFTARMHLRIHRESAKYASKKRGSELGHGE